MTITEVRKKVKHLKRMLSDWDTTNALINAMQRANKQGLDINDQYLSNAIRHRDKLLNEFNNVLK